VHGRTLGDSLRRIKNFLKENFTPPKWPDPQCGKASRLMPPMGVAVRETEHAAHRRHFPRQAAGGVADR